MEQNLTPVSSPKRFASFDTPDWTKSQDIVPTENAVHAENLNDIDFSTGSITTAENNSPEEENGPGEENGRGEDTAPAGNTVSEVKACFKVSQTMLTTQELLLYVLVEIVFPVDTYKKYHSTLQFANIQSVLFKLIHTKYTICSIRNIFLKVKSEQTSSKTRLPWIKYRTVIDAVKDKHRDDLTLLLNKQQITTNQCACIIHTLEENVSQQSPNMTNLLNFFNEEIKGHVKHVWEAEIIHSNLHAYCFTYSRGYASIELVVDDALHLKLYVENKLVERDLSIFDIETSNVNKELLKRNCLAIDRLTLCNGVTIDETVSKVVSQAESDVLYKTKDGEDGASVVQTHSKLRQQCIKSSFCWYFLFKDETLSTAVLCDACVSAKKYLRKKNVNMASVEGSKKNGRHNNLSKSELMGLLSDQNKTLRSMKKQIQRLEKYRDKMHTVGHKTNEDLTFILNKLQNGLSNRQEKINNPKCKWNLECDLVCEDVEGLYQHVISKHMPSTELDTCPSERNYKCGWRNCSKEFTKMRLLKQHVREHTGSASDEFMAILLKDQAKALNLPARSMKWHPLVIKWCLRTWSQSHSLYNQMRDANFLILPTGRTLSDYKNFNNPDSGWHKGNIIQMKNTIEKKKAPVRVNVGGLYFDELKIKEGLVWDPHTWEMIGFVDLDINENGEDTEDHLATHILQFFYRSLFYKFEYPCAYILTNNTTAETLNHLFWTGVSQLEQEHINIMVVCCDGASENRKMINMNLLNDTGIGYNPFSHLPMFFISDPPHLLKKLRNNLFKSGDMSKERFTRHLKINENFAEWKHIEDAFDREKKRYQPVTRLTQEGVYLDSLSKMRVKLAVHTLHQDVIDEMAENCANKTQGTQSFIHHCVQIWSVLNSNMPIASTTDARCTKLEESLYFFKLWHAELQIQFPADKKKVSDSFIAWQTFSDLQLTIKNFINLIKFIEGNTDLAERYEESKDLYIIPNRINQDFVESFFSRQRQLCGGTQNMTSHAYGYNINSCLTISSSRLVKYKQTNVMEVKECQAAVEEKSTLPKRRSKNSLLENIVCPL